MCSSDIRTLCQKMIERALPTDQRRSPVTTISVSWLPRRDEPSSHSGTVVSGPHRRAISAGIGLKSIAAIPALGEAVWLPAKPCGSRRSREARRRRGSPKGRHHTIRLTWAWTRSVQTRGYRPEAAAALPGVIGGRCGISSNPLESGATAKSGPSHSIKRQAPRFLFVRVKCVLTRWRQHKAERSER